MRLRTAPPARRHPQTTPVKHSSAANSADKVAPTVVPTTSPAHARRIRASQNPAEDTTPASPAQDARSSYHLDFSMASGRRNVPSRPAARRMLARTAHDKAIASPDEAVAKGKQPAHPPSAPKERTRLR